jgi:hypothetical protein
MTDRRYPRAVAGQLSLDLLIEFKRENGWNVDLNDRRQVMQRSGPTVTDAVSPLAGGIAGVPQDAMQGSYPKWAPRRVR